MGMGTQKVRHHTYNHPHPPTSALIDARIRIGTLVPQVKSQRAHPRTHRPHPQRLPRLRILRDPALSRAALRPRAQLLVRPRHATGGVQRDAAVDLLHRESPADPLFFSLSVAESTTRVKARRNRSHAGTM